MKIFNYVLLLLLVSNNTFSQIVNIKGRVITENGEPLKGATVTAISGNRQTVGETNSKGNFILSEIGYNSVLQTTHVGYEPKRVNLEGRLEIIITLKEKPGELDEVIVQAYGTTTRRLSTGNITKIASKEIETQPVSNPLAALEGRVPGVTITQTSGVPGSSFNVEIRGRTFLDQALSKNDPLFVIDGVFFEPGNQPSNQLRSAANDNFGQGGLSPLNSINPADIESIEVLKDADATAIYGSRGANGVILITTKKGKAGATKITANVYTGVSTPTRTMDMLSTQQYVAMRREGFKNDRITPSANPFDPGYAPDIMLWDTTRYTDFKNLLIGNTARTTDAQLSLSGGNQLTQFLIGGGFHRETNVFSKNLYATRASAHFSINHNSENRKLNVVFSGGYSNDNNQLISTDLTQYINIIPNLQMYNADGTLSWEQDGVSYATVNNFVNPLSVLLKTNTTITENLYSNLQAGYKVLPSLLFKISMGYNTFKNNEVGIIPKAAIDPFTYAWITPSASFANSSDNSWIIEPQLNYRKSISRGKLNILIGGTLQEKKYCGNVIQASKFSNDLLLKNPAAAGLVMAQGSQSLYHYEAVFGRINYDWKDKYLLNVTFRRDGSSRFGPDKQFANFGAVGAGWIFTEEPRIKDKLSFLSFGKLRASYGVTGNDQIGDYNFMNLWSNSSNTYQGIATLNPDKLYNPDFGWETNKKLEGAVELGLLKDRIFLSISYYRNRSNNQLVNYPLPNQTGSQSVVMNLPALVQNSGLELVLTTKNITNKKFSWTTSINATIPRNKLISFPGLSLTSYKSTFVEGQPLSVIYRYKYMGVDPETGVYAFDDTNKDGAITTADYQISGNLNPKFYGGLVNTLTFHNIQFQFLFEFKKQLGKNYLYQLYNSPPGFIINQPQVVLNRWQKPGDIAGVQQFIATYSGGSAELAANTLGSSDGIYGDASYIRLRNVSLSFNLPAYLLNKIKMSGVKVYINAQNLLTVTNYIGLDPETQNMYVLPPLKTIVAGIQLTF